MLSVVGVSGTAIAITSQVFLLVCGEVKCDHTKLLGEHVNP